MPRSARILLSLAAVVIIVAGMRAAAAILLPFFIAGYVAVAASGPLYWLERKGVPRVLAVLLVIAAILGFGGGVGTLVGTSLNDFLLTLPEYEARLEEMRDQVVAFLRSQGIDVPETSLMDLVDPRVAMTLTANLLKGVGGLLADFLLILIAVVFLLVEMGTVKRGLGGASARTDASNGGFDRFEGSVRRYMAIKTAISLANGTLVTIWLSILGVDFAFLWGLMSCLLNFVPNIGSFIAAVPAVLVALIQLGPWHAGLVIVGYLAIEFVLGSLVEPRFMGRGLGLSPLVVFMSLVFWGWVFGPVGMLLSVLLTVTLKIALESGEETRSLAVLMGGEAEAAAGSRVVAADPEPPKTSARPAGGDEAAGG